MRKDWVYPQLKELTSLVIGGDWGKDPITENDEDFVEVFCIRGSEFRNWGREKGKTASLRKIKKSSLEKRQLIIGDVLLEISGGGPDQPVGRTVIIDKKALNQNNGSPKVCTNFFRLVRFHENLNKEFLNYYLQYFYHSGEVVKYQGGSNNLRNLKFKEYETIKIPLPPLQEQNRIVTKLDKLFEQLEVMNIGLEKIPVLLKNFRQQLLTQAVTGKLTEEWRSGKGMPAPKTTSLKHLGKWMGGGTPSKGINEYWCEGTVPWITPKDMKKLFLSSSKDKITLDAIKNSSANLIPKNSILMVTRSGILRRIFPVSSNTVETTVNQDLKALIPKENINYKYILYSLRGLERDIRINCMKGGTTVESIEFSLLKDYNILLPEIEEQREIVKCVENLFQKADAIEQQYLSLKKKIEGLPQAITHRAFKGELVPEWESDGDARELLEEIERLRKAVGTKTKNGKPKIKKYETGDVELSRAAVGIEKYEK